MHVVDLIQFLNEKNIFPYVEEGKLKTRSVDAHIAADVVSLIGTHKDELIAFLSAHHPSQTQSQRIKIPKATLQSKIPLSYGQRALWFIDGLEGSTQYHLSGSLIARGVINEAIGCYCSAS